MAGLGVGMKLWYLNIRPEMAPPGGTRDFHIAFVVRAHSQKRAREVATERAREYKDARAEVWLDSKQTTCKELKAWGEESIIISDYCGN